MLGGGCGRVRRGAGQCWLLGAIPDCYWQQSHTAQLLYTNRKHQIFRAACCEGVYCASISRMGSSNSSVAKTCPSIAFLARNHVLVCEQYTAPRLKTQDFQNIRMWELKIRNSITVSSDPITGDQIIPKYVANPTKYNSFSLLYANV
jgi:hypothetical protein